MSVVHSPARIRRNLHLLFALLLCVGGWIYLGNAGAALLLLRARAAWPSGGPRELVLRLERVSQIRLYSRALVIREFGGDCLWIFADEMPPADYAALRRTLRAQIEGLL